MSPSGGARPGAGRRPVPPEERFQKRPLSLTAEAAAQDHDLSDDERRAIRSLKMLAKRWPKSLWLFSANGGLTVMRAGPDGERVHRGEAIDPAYAIEEIVGIPNDGGDW